MGFVPIYSSISWLRSKEHTATFCQFWALIFCTHVIFWTHILHSWTVPFNEADNSNCSLERSQEIELLFGTKSITWFVIRNEVDRSTFFHPSPHKNFDQKINFIQNLAFSGLEMTSKWPLSKKLKIAIFLLRWAAGYFRPPDSGFWRVLFQMVRVSFPHVDPEFKMGTPLSSDLSPKNNFLLLFCCNFSPLLTWK